MVTEMCMKYPGDPTRKRGTEIQYGTTTVALFSDQQPANGQRADVDLSAVPFWLGTRIILLYSIGLLVLFYYYILYYTSP